MTTTTRARATRVPLAHFDAPLLTDAAALRAYFAWYKTQLTAVAWLAVQPRMPVVA